MPLTKVSYSMLSGAPINVCDYGAVGDDNTINDSAFAAAEAIAASQKKALYIPSGIYKITTTFNCSVSILGDSPYTSIIKNYGTGNCIDASGLDYYSTFENFCVDGSGNALSQDGITLYNAARNPAYCHFFNVYSRNNGRHGLYHRLSWGTRYSQCKFFDNGGLGVYCDTEVGVDLGTANDVTFMQCDARGNGGATSGFGGDFGGVKIKGAACVAWIGGIIESNNGFGVYIGDAPGGSATRSVSFQQTYMEYNGWDAAVGAAFYVTGPWMNVVVEECWLAYGAKAGNTNYMFYVGSSLDGGNFVERNNTYNNIGEGGGTSVKYYGGQFSSPQKSIGTAPIIYVYQDAATSVTVPNTTPTKLRLNVKAWDSNNNYDDTLYRFTPTVAGYYRFNAKVNNFPAGGGTFWAAIYQNGNEFWRGQVLDTTSIGSPSAVVDCLALANGTDDYFELFIFQSSGSSQAYTPGFAQCAMQVNYVKNT